MKVIHNYQNLNSNLPIFNSKKIVLYRIRSVDKNGRKKREDSKGKHKSEAKQSKVEIEIYIKFKFKFIQEIPSDSLRQVTSDSHALETEPSSHEWVEL